jgi:hypothetical protein
MPTSHVVIQIYVMAANVLTGDVGVKLLVAIAVTIQHERTPLHGTWFQDVRSPDEDASYSASNGQWMNT